MYSNVAGPPSILEKAIRLGRIFGSFDSLSSNTSHEQPSAAAATEDATSSHRRRKRHATCQNLIDLAILIDSSGSISSTNFYKARNDVASLIRYTCNDFTCDSGPRVNLALVTFGDTRSTIFNFAYSKNYHGSLTSMVNSIYRARYLGGGTEMTAALNYVNNYIFTSSRGMRECSERRLIVLSDGLGFVGANVRAAASNLHNNKKVDIYAFGIDSGTSWSGLRNLMRLRSETTNNVLPYFSYKNYKDFSWAVQYIASLNTNYGTTCRHSAIKK